MSDRLLRATILVLAALGLGVAGYLTATHLFDAPIACATGGCETVASSRYSEIAGIPVAAGGMVAYLLILGSAVGRGELVRALGLAAAAAGFAVSMVLLYVQAAVLHAFCQWCLTSDAIFVALVPLTALRAWRGAPPDARPSSPAPRPAG